LSQAGMAATGKMALLVNMSGMVKKLIMANRDSCDFTITAIERETPAIAKQNNVVIKSLNRRQAPVSENYTIVL